MNKFETLFCKIILEIYKTPHAMWCFSNYPNMVIANMRPSTHFFLSINFRIKKSHQRIAR